MNDYVEVTIRLKAEVVAALERHYATLSIEDIVTAMARWKYDYAEILIHANNKETKEK